MPGTASGVVALADELLNGMSSSASRSGVADVRTAESADARELRVAGAAFAEVSALSALSFSSSPTCRAEVSATFSPDAHAVAPPIVTSVPPAFTHPLSLSSASLLILDS